MFDRRFLEDQLYSPDLSEVSIQGITERQADAVASFAIAAGARALALSFGVPAVLPGTSALIYYALGQYGIPRSRDEQFDFIMDFVKENPQTYPLFKHQFPLLF